MYASPQFVLGNVVVRIWQSFGRYGLCTFGLRGPRGRAAFGDGYSCVLRDCVTVCAPLFYCVFGWCLHKPPA